ncbi:MAG TPA: hypothetical protein VGK73_01230 [Polyangiaceae bacterium]
MLTRRLLVPSLLVPLLFTLHCSDGDSGSEDKGDAGEGGDDAGGSAGSNAGKAGSSGRGGGGDAGSETGGGGGTTAGSAGSSAAVCEAGETRACVGPAGCEGGQECETSGVWSACDCGDGAGGTAGGGTSSGAGEGGQSGSGGDDGGRGGSGGIAQGGTAGTGASGGASAAGGSAGSSGTAGTTGGNAGSSGAAGSSGGSAGSSGGGAGAGGAGAGGGSGAGGSSAGTAGTAGAGGSGGSAGKGGASGSGGSSGGACTLPGQGLELVMGPGDYPDSGWIDRSGNCLGIQGAVYAYADTRGSSIELTPANGRICVEGVSAQVLGGDYANYWGTMVVVQLNNPGTGALLSYNAAQYGIDGFEFRLSGPDVPDEVRPEITAHPQLQYCKQVCASGEQSILFSEAHLECWDGTNGATPNASAIVTLHFRVPSNPFGDVPFEFCIDDLTAITDGAPVGDPGECTSPGDPSSCEGFCGDMAPSGCFCDYLCEDTGDCCDDFEAVCN